MTLLVVRHAHAGDRSVWAGDDARRPLSPDGRAQAEALVDRLAGYPLERVLTSPYDRCVETVQPLAASRGLEVEQADVLAEGSPASAVRALLRELGTAPAVLCSHGDVIGDLVGRLRADGVDLGGRVDWQKGSTWALTVDAGGVTAGRYLPPP